MDLCWLGGCPLSAAPLQHESVQNKPQLHNQHVPKALIIPCLYFFFFLVVVFKVN